MGLIRGIIVTQPNTNPPNPNILISFRLCMHILVHTRVCLTSLLYFLIYAAIRIKLAFYDKI